MLSTDAVFVIQEHLASRYSAYNKNVYILPNSINFNDIYTPPRNSKKPVVLWQGSSTHKKDVALAEKGLRGIIKDNDSFDPLKLYP